MTRAPSNPVPPISAERDPIRAYPPTTTFHDLIRANKRKSTWLIALMILLAIVVGTVIAAAVTTYLAGGGDPETIRRSAITGAIAALLFALVATLWSWFGGASAILAMSGAKPIEKHDDPELFNVVDELRLAAGLPMPRVFLIDSPALNAFATGRDPQHAAVAITRGLRQALTRDELSGVMAHEMAHVRHLDIRFAMLMATMVGLIAFAADAFVRMAFHGARMGGARRSSSSGKGSGAGAAAIILIVLALLLAVIAPLLAKLIQLAYSRQREFLADAGAVELTRNPEGLIGALRKLSDSEVPLKGANRATAHLYIVNPFKKAAMQHHARSSVFSTHPAMQDRINRLNALLR